MVKRHLSRLNAPKIWQIKRKGIKFITRANPGAHSLKTSIPLNLVLKEMLGLAKTTSEVKKVLHAKAVLVNNKVRKDYKFPVGIMDVIEIPKMKESFRMLLNTKGKFMLKKIDDKENKLKPFKIIEKTIMKKGKVQLNLDDGSNLIVEKDSYKVNDTLVFDLEKKKIVEHLPFDKGALIYITGGNKVASLGKLQNILTFKGFQPANIVFKTKDGEFETRKRYAMVIGKDKPVIALEA